MKIGNLDISSIKVGSADCKVYLGDTLLYPTAPPAFQGKWKATYTGGSVTSAECDASSAITTYEIDGTDLETIIVGDCVTSIGDWAISWFESLTSVTIPNSVTTIGNSAFEGCSSLINVTIGSGVTTLGYNAFSRCSSLTGITIPSGVTNIDGATFSNCSSLTSITIPSGVTRIGGYAFDGCSGLTSITINAENPPLLDGNSIFNDTNDCPIYVPNESVQAYKSAWVLYASRIQAIP